MYIKYKKVRCTVNCYFESEKAHIIHKNGAYKPEHFEKIKEIIAYKFDFVLQKHRIGNLRQANGNIMQ